MEDSSLQDLLDQLEDDKPGQTVGFDPTTTIDHGDVDQSEHVETAPLPEVVNGDGMVIAAEIIAKPSEAVHGQAEKPRQLDIIPEAQTTVVLDQQAHPIDIKKYVDRLDDTTIEVLAACRSDRAETQEVITSLKTALTDSLGRNETPDRQIVEGLVQALEVKSTINQTAVKMIDASIKLLAATKASSQINVTAQSASLNGGTGSAVLDEQLRQILDNKMDEDAP